MDANGIAGKMGTRAAALAGYSKDYAAALARVIAAGDRLDSAHHLGVGVKEARLALKEAKAAAEALVDGALSAEVSAIEAAKAVSK